MLLFFYLRLIFCRLSFLMPTFTNRGRWEGFFGAHLCKWGGEGGVLVPTSTIGVGGRLFCCPPSANGVGDFFGAHLYKCEGGGQAFWAGISEAILCANRQLVLQNRASLHSLLFHSLPSSVSLNVSGDKSSNSSLSVLN